MRLHFFISVVIENSKVDYSEEVGQQFAKIRGRNFDLSRLRKAILLSVIDSCHCHVTKKINWKPSSGKSEENEML